MNIKVVIYVLLIKLVVGVQILNNVYQEIKLMHMKINVLVDGYLKVVKIK